MARLAAHGLALDAWCYHPQLADVIALARAVPQATIVMCHFGGVLGYGAYTGKKATVEGMQDKRVLSDATHIVERKRSLIPTLRRTAAMV